MFFAVFTLFNLPLTVQLSCTCEFFVLITLKYCSGTAIGIAGRCAPDWSYAGTDSDL